MTIFLNYLKKHAEKAYGRAMHLWFVACHFVIFQSCISEEHMKRVKSTVLKRQQSFDITKLA